MTDEPMTALTSKVVVPSRRAAEWMQGTRPLDGMDANFYFKTLVDTGLITQERAFELHLRHIELTRREQAGIRRPVCGTCNDTPPAGYACLACGTTSNPGPTP